MDADGILQFASSTTAGLANVIMRFAVQKKQPNCSRLATELFCASKHLELEQEGDSTVLEVQTFLRRLEEKLFHQKQSSNYTRLIPFDGSYGDVRGQLKAANELQVQLLAMVKASAGQIEEISRDVDYFNKRRERKLSTTRSSATSQVIVTKTSSQHEDTLENPSLSYDILRQHLQCRCRLLSTGVQNHSPHLGRLLLSSKLCRDQDNNVQLDMLFFTSSSQAAAEGWCWQDVRLLLTRQAWNTSIETQNSSIKKKKARFAGDSPTTSSKHPGVGIEEVPHGEFCRFLIMNNRSRLRFGIAGGRLYVFDPHNEGIERFVIPPSVALSTVLQGHHLNTRMRVTLAYILASSVWQYYNSGWMKSVWTSETIHFITEHNIEESTTDLYITKPYLSVHFDENSEIDKDHTGAVHQDPTILALGIMLVEIGRGTMLQRPADLYPDSSPSGRLNSDWTQASILVNSKKPWPDFDSTTANSSLQITELESAYRQVVKNCLDPKLFKKRAANPNEDQAKGMEQSREVLYRSVVAILETLMRDSKYIDDMDNKDASRLEGKHQLPKSITEKQSGVFLEDPIQQKDRVRAERWLERMYLLQRKLGLDLQARPSQDRIRVAVIDTGYDAESVFFAGKRGHRVPKNSWIDFVGGSTTPIDEDGHGTAMVSLVMKVAPQADICVARVAKKPQNLSESTDNVGKAIEWAQTCKAHIVLMSFGYEKEQDTISAAIYDSIKIRKGKIILIAAASNAGGEAGEMFPASHESVISIRATSKSGNFADFNPPRDSRESFVLGSLGIEVPCASLSSGDPSDTYLTGTSVAAAIVAGMGAMMLAYVNSNSSRRSYSVVKDRLERRRGMLALLHRLGRETVFGHRYISLWDFGKISEDEQWSLVEDAVSSAANI